MKYLAFTFIIKDGSVFYLIILVTIWTWYLFLAIILSIDRKETTCQDKRMSSLLCLKRFHSNQAKDISKLYDCATLSCT